MSRPAMTTTRVGRLRDGDIDGNPRISVVIPTCGRPALLRRCLDALLDQSGIGRDDYEIVVVDDRGDSATRRLVDGFAVRPGAPRMRCLAPFGAHGPAAARNAGWRAARGAIIAFTDDDTEPAPDWLQRGEGALRGGDFVAVAGRIEVPRMSHDRCEPSDHELMTRGLEQAEFVTANAFVRRDALEHIGGFDTRFTRAWREDTDLQYRLERQVGPIGRTGALVRHPVRPERWGVSLRQQRHAYFEALLKREHPQRYRRRADTATPWHYYTIVGATLAGVVFAARGRPLAAGAAGTLALSMIGRFTQRRLRGTRRDPAHVTEMVVTSAVIPFLSVYWRLRGAIHFRTWLI